MQIVFDEEYEELDFVQEHKKIPVNLTMHKSCSDSVSRQDAPDISENLSIIADDTGKSKTSRCVKLYKRQIRPMHYCPAGQGFSPKYDPIIFEGREWHEEDEEERLIQILEPTLKKNGAWDSLKFDERYVVVFNPQGEKK